MTTGQLLGIVPLVIIVLLIYVSGFISPPPSLERFEHMSDDARQFLTTFCSRFSSSVVSVVEEPSGCFSLKPAASGSVPVHISVADYDPIVVVSIDVPGDEVILEWMADLESYDRSWWQARVEPVLALVAAGRVRDATGPWYRGTPHFAPWATPDQE